MFFLQFLIKVFLDGVKWQNFKVLRFSASGGYMVH